MDKKEQVFHIELVYKYEVITDDIERTMSLRIDPRFPDVDANLNVNALHTNTYYKRLDKSEIV